MDPRCYPTLTEASRAAAAVIAEAAAAAVAARRRFTLALAGGATPRRLYKTLAAPPYRTGMPWQDVHLFWGDERCVAPTATASNFRLAAETLLATVPLPPANIHPMPVEFTAPAAAAERYQAELEGLFTGQDLARAPETGAAFPIFDCILLGMGSDGHTASLFPGSTALAEERRWVVAALPPAGTEPPVPRLTLTLPVINHARLVLFLIAGPQKKAILHAMQDDPKARNLPAAAVRPAGRLLWLVADRDG